MFQQLRYLGVVVMMGLPMYVQAAAPRNNRYMVVKRQRGRAN